MPEFRPFSLGDAVSRVQQIAGNQMRLSALPGQIQSQQTQNQQREQLNEQELMINDLALIKEKINSVYDQGSYEQIVAEGEQSGILPPGSMPREYDDQARDILAKIQGNVDSELKKLTLTRGGPGREPMSQDYLQQGNNLTPYGDPYKKGGGGKDSRTALQKNVPFLAKTMGISKKEAAELLSQSKDKSPKRFWGDVYGRALSANFGDQEAATKAANAATKRLYGPNWDKPDTGNDPDGIRDLLMK